MYLDSMLEQSSYKVTTNELESVALLLIQEKNDRFKLVMANVNMADMNILSFLRALIEMKIPVILMASERNGTVVRKALAEGACLFLKKPISWHDLKYVWQHVFRKKSNNPLMVETRKPELERDIYHSIRVNNPDEEDNQILEAIQAFPVDENTVKESQNEESRKQGELIKGKRSLEEDKGGESEEAKRRKLNTDNVNTNNTISSEGAGKKMSEINGSSRENNTRRTVWTPELHLKFTEALSVLGDRKARPKLILQMMNIPHLTQRQVASHLQKYKSQVKQISDNVITNIASACKPSSTIYATGSLPTLKSYEFAVVSGTPQGADIVQGEYISGSSRYVLNNAGKSPTGFSDGNQEMNVIEVPKPLAGSVNQNEPLFEHADMMKLLDEDEELKTGLGGGPNPGDLDRYCEWLAEALKEN